MLKPVGHTQIPSALLSEDTHRHISTQSGVEWVGMLFLERVELLSAHNFLA